MPRTRYTKKDDPQKYAEMLESQNLQEPDGPDEQKFLAGDALEDKYKSELAKMDIVIRGAWLQPSDRHRIVLTQQRHRLARSIAQRGVQPHVYLHAPRLSRKVIGSLYANCVRSGPYTLLLNGELRHVDVLVLAVIYE